MYIECNADYDINTSIDKEYLTSNVTKDISWIDIPRTSTHKKWFQKRKKTLKSKAFLVDFQRLLSGFFGLF